MIMNYCSPDKANMDLRFMKYIPPLGMLLLDLVELKDDIQLLFIICH